MDKNIKMIAWDKKNNKIVQIDSIEFIDRMEGRTGCNVFTYGIPPRNCYWLESNEVDLLRRTGIKDKNNQDIYEGHICKTDSGTLGEICYDETRAGFMFRDNLNEMLYLVSPLEIVGFAQENPELLKQIEAQ